MLETTLLLDLGALLLVCAIAWLLGRLVRSAVGLGKARYRPVSDGAVDLALGLSALHVLLLTLDLLNIPWTLAWVGSALLLVFLLLAAIQYRWHGSRRNFEAGGEDRLLALGWGDLLILAVVGWLVLLSPTGVATTPDFIYQWGIKGHRFLLAEGVDWGFLAGSLGNAPSPDYPNLVPNLFVLTSLLRGGFSETAAALWTPALLLVAWGGVRGACSAAGVPARSAQAIIAGTALLLGMFTTGYRLVGGADLNIAAALLLALSPLIWWRGTRDDLAVGAAAALAVGSKQEGLPLAFFLTAVYTVVHWRRVWSSSATDTVLYLLRVVALPLIVVAPWALQVLRYDLLGATHPGGPVRWSALSEVGGALVASLQVPQWHGLGWLVLLIPFFLCLRRTRAVGLVLLLQATAYLAVYLRHPGEQMETYVLINAPRLVFHLVPAVLCATAVFMASPRRPGSRLSTVAPLPRAALRAGVLALSVWIGFGFLAEQWQALEALRSREGSGVVARWRLGEERSESLRRFLADVDRATYPGSIIAFDPQVEGGDQSFYLTLWTAYFLPGKQVIPASHPDAPRQARYVVTYNHNRAPPEAELVYLHPSGAVYWLDPSDQ